MKYRLNLLVCSALLSLLVLPEYAMSRVIRMDYSIGGQTPQFVYVNLLDADVPNTVANFLNYVQDGAGVRRYDGIFIHRSVRPPAIGIDIIQGGGFTLVAGLPVGVTADTPIVNEYSASRPNVRGTLAMAKLGGDPDSATSEWFFNVIDNSTTLDASNNGGFTVFGSVLGDGMAVVDAIAQVATQSLGGIFTDVPTLNRPLPSPISEANLVVLTQVVIDPPARVSANAGELDFGLVGLNLTSDIHTVTIRNIGGVDGLVIGTIGVSSNNISIVNDGCSDAVLVQLQSCNIDLVFTPTSSGAFQATLSVPSNDSLESFLQVVVRGTGGEATPALSLVFGNAIDFGSVVSGQTTDRLVRVQNIGNVPVSFGPSAPQLDNTTDFSINPASDTCSGLTLNVTALCEFVIRFSASGNAGSRTGGLALVSLEGVSTSASLTGEVVTVPPSNIFLPLGEMGVYEFGDIEIGVLAEFGYPIINLGPGDLIFGATRLSGPDAGEFQFSDDCDVLVINLGSISSCSVSFTVTPSSLGRKEFTLEVDSNDPDTPTATVTIIVTVSQDSDGVPDGVEQAGPNGGDGNGDGVPDMLQPDVASLPDINGDYITLETDAERLVGVQSADNPSPDTTPIALGGTLSFPSGFFNFNIEGLADGGAATVTLTLPPGTRPDSYFKYNRQQRRWYTFEFQSASGTGAVFDRNRVILNFVDGQRGDNDLLVNGVIEDPGGPVVLALNAAGGGGGGGCVMSVSSVEDIFPVDLLLLLLGLLGIVGRRKVV